MRFMVVLLAGILLAGAPVQGAEAAGAHGDGPRIGVLRLTDVLLGFKMYTDGMGELKKERNVGQTEIDAIQERMKDLDGKKGVLNPDSDVYAANALEFEQLKVKVKLIAEHGTAQLSNRRASLLKSCFATIRANLQGYCQANGIKLVHLAPNPDIEGSDNQELNQALLMQSVLYYDPALDITDAFVPYLNQHWEADLAKAHPAAPAPTPDPALQSGTQAPPAGAQAK